MTYTELIQKSAAVFDKELVLPINLLFQNTIDKKRCPGEKAVKLYDYRRWQAHKLGLTQLDPKELIRVLYDSAHNVTVTAQKSVYYEYVYNHHTGRNETKRWTHCVDTHCRYKDYGLFHWPPYERKLLWSCNFCNINELSSEVPSGVMLKILRLQTLKIFNAFHAIDPLVPKVKPVFIGTIWEMPPSFFGMGEPTYRNIGCTAHFFLSEWC